ncbi:MAG TPA: oligosaccharide flippase family protein [Ignavibacteriales bacterium]|nr:oligosaccharide flippase family protein [Ignavibacteriales bacterium]
MEKSFTLKENFIWTFSGNAFYAFTQWLILVMLARNGNPAMVGQFALAMALTAPVVLFSNLKLRDVQATDINHDFQFRHYFILRTWTVISSLAVIAGIAVWGNYKMNTVAVILIIACVKSLESISDIVYGHHQQKENMKVISLSLFYRGIISAFGFYMVMKFSGSIVWGCMSLLLTRLGVLVFYDMKSVGYKAEALKAYAFLKSYFAKGIVDKKAAELFRISFPLGFAALAVSLIPNIPNYVLEKYNGEYELGLFSSLMYMQVIGNTLVLALGQAASPRLSRLYDKGNSLEFTMFFLRLLAGAVILGLLGVAAAGLFGERILGMLLGRVYSEHNDLFILVMIAGGISYVVSFTGYALLSIKKYPAQVWINTAVLLSSLILSLALISTRGILGAAYSMIFTMLTQAVLNISVVFYQIYKEYKIKLIRNGIRL